MQFKGKSTTRSWAQLPPDVVRQVITHLLLDVSAQAFLPHTWQSREQWLPRMVYNVVRDTEIIEQIMLVAPAWKSAIEYHLYWQHAIAVMDPNDALVSFYRNQARVSPYKHFRYNVLDRCCVPCRINQPSTSSGLLTSKRQVLTYALGHVPCCKDHRKDTFCGVCLRDCMSEESGILENEDFECWPQIESTCRVCRMDWLWRAAMDGERQGEGLLTKEAEAIGGKQLAPADWEARQAVEQFVDMGEGTIREVIALCVEKLWLRRHTKIADMMSLAVATSRLQRNGGTGGGYGRMLMSDTYESEEDFSEVDDEDDPDLLSITEDVGGVRDLAINDWARSRILEGHWLSPADQWYALQGQASPEWSHPPHIAARHPCPWVVPESDSDQPHPSQITARSSPPPSLQLCSSAFEAYKRQLRMLLLPAMTNIVRRIVMECAMDGADPCIRTAKMEVEDVANALRDGGVWYNGTDWFRRRDEDSEKKDDASDSSSSSSKSDSDATSPVLSTSTLQTTPSPPPILEHKKIRKDVCSSASMAPPRVVPSQRNTLSSPIISTLPIPVSPVLESPTQIPSIPYIPHSVAMFPQFTVESFKTIWREATEPLFQCKCSVCERAVLKTNLEVGALVPSQQYNEITRVIPDEHLHTVESPLEVQLHPAAVEDDRFLPGDTEEDDRFLSSPNVSDILESDMEEVNEDGPFSGHQNSVQEVDSRSIDRENMEALIQSRKYTPPSSPSKRARLSDALSSDDIVPVSDRVIPEAIRLAKRSSEELDEDIASGGEGTAAVTQHKRARTESSSSTLPSPRHPPSSETESLSEKGDSAFPAFLSSSTAATPTAVNSAFHLIKKASRTAATAKVVRSIGDALEREVLELDNARLYVMDDANSDVDIEEMEVSR